jgi:hypothetical protein
MKTDIQNIERVAGEGSSPASTLDSEGLRLKSAAIQKLERARALIDAAREDMCNLEGRGYCDNYEEAGDLSERMEKLTSNYSRLAPPTGVFKW